MKSLPLCSTTVLLTTFLFGAAGLPGLTLATDDALDRARRLLRASPLIDGHNDLPWALRELSPDDPLAVDLHVLQEKLMTDMVKIREGGLGGQFWVCYVPASAARTGQAAHLAQEQIDLIHRLVERYPDTLELALTAGELRAAHARGRVGSLIGMEGGHMIENSLPALRNAYRLGVRYMTLTHSDNVDWADSATDEPVHGGLTPFGKEVVREMNRLGMLVDLSHVSDETMRDALRVSEAPVIFSHSSARSLADHVRNVPDDILRMVGDKKGVVMVNFSPTFVSAQVARARKGSFAAFRRFSRLYPANPAERKRAMDRWLEQHPAPPATLSQVADHMDHIRQVAGVASVGIGSDFDGISSVPVGLEDVSRFPALLAELLRRGWTEEDVTRAMGENLLRVLEQAEKTAKRLQDQRSPSSARIEDFDAPGQRGGKP
ncbi:MAG: dipeptidase [Acidobacteriota bacterium]